MAFEAFFEALGITFTLPVLGGILLGLLLGLVFGAVPGLNAVLGIVLLLPFVWTLSPFVAFAIMLSLVSAVHTSNTFPAFFFNVPGSPSAAATILDGYPMARNGDAARGLTAAFMVSAVGGVIGALVLLFALPALQPVVLAFAAPERFMLVVLGILMISFLSGAKPVKGLLAGTLGLWLGTVGQDPQLGVARFTFELDYLLDGLQTVPIIMGLFALPEVVSLAIRGSIAERTHVDMGEGFRPGLRACIVNRWLVVRSAVVGVVGGAIPGIGGTAAAFYAYGMAVQGAKGDDRERFGKGEIKGVIAPESANNASAGGELVPLLAFGVPGGATSAILLAAFLILGINPGPEMLGEKLSLSFSMVIVLVLSNLLATAVCIAITRPARAHRLPQEQPADPGADAVRAVRLLCRLSPPLHSRPHPGIRRAGLPDDAVRLGPGAAAGGFHPGSPGREQSRHLPVELRRGLSHPADPAGVHGGHGIGGVRVGAPRGA